ncbi:hypothetical protein EG329_009486 [Mollisiaceae sp. DMI_Dod_QoI]|nr:hypothetical protein EG329_009486 [Helotiales sp. DMI_Dod_QoI]
MMAPCNPPKRPAAIELIRMISGPRVDVYVGPGRKHYSLPKDLLCHYSTYFDRCFNGAFKEANQQKLSLPEDKVKDFEVLMEYMLSGTTATFEVTEIGGAAVVACMDFLRYADKYTMGYVGQIIEEPLRKALEHLSNLAHQVKKPKDPVRPEGITGDDIELVFRTSPANSRLRAVVVLGAIAYNGPKGMSRFVKQEQTVDGFAAEVCDNVRSVVYSLKYWNPHTGKSMTQ